MHEMKSQQQETYETESLPLFRFGVLTDVQVSLFPCLGSSRFKKFC